jgi:hypothetical protein
VVFSSPETAHEAQEREEYIDPEGVCKYLSEKGLAIDSKSLYLEVSNLSLTSTSDSVNTIFDEMRRNEKVVISVSALLCGKRHLV